MATSSNIQWTEATWNPATGCNKVSPGCKNCYAEAMSARLKAMGNPKYAAGFAYTEHPHLVDQPLRWKKPRRIFVNSMSDLFHEEATFPFVARCFATMYEADRHTYQILTKRPGRMATFCQSVVRRTGRPIPPHVWLGTSVEDGNHVDRIAVLRAIPCTTRFVSFEPLIGPVPDVDLGGIDWAIIGGESGRGNRPVRKEWITGLIDLCKRQGVSVFFKQWGGVSPKSGGNEIDGRTYLEYPTPAFGDGVWGPLDREAAMLRGDLYGPPTEPPAHRIIEPLAT